MNGAIQAAIVALEEEAMQADGRARQCRDLATRLREIDDLVPVIGKALTPREQREPARAEVRRQQSGPRPIKQRPGRKTAPIEEDAAKVLAYLKTQTAPAKFAQLRKAVNLRAARLRRALDHLCVEGGMVIRTGKTSSTRIGVPSVMRLAPAPPPTNPKPRASGSKLNAPADAPKRGPGRPQKAPAVRKPDATAAKNSTAAADARRRGYQIVLAEITKVAPGVASWPHLQAASGLSMSNLAQVTAELIGAGTIVRMETKPVGFRLLTEAERAARPKVRTIPVPAGIDLHALTQKVTQIFASGASYDLNDILRNCRATFPSIDRELAAKVVDGLFEKGMVQRIPVGLNVRFQRLAKWGEKAEAIA